MAWAARKYLFCKTQSGRFSLHNNLNAILQCLHNTLFFLRGSYNSLLQGNHRCAVTLLASAKPHGPHGPENKLVTKKRQRTALIHSKNQDIGITAKMMDQIFRSWQINPSYLQLVSADLALERSGVSVLASLALNNRATTRV